eukprot:TRINITY_DN80095_c0_g1_i1.p1 TRINITY_DN80095_c0_g1~~TRINITY_DN80095_c0_g1_i1.p1  ORF type:complete len:1078 (+),score=265.00 TRINITY_DN80095_c0_g1_i1:322-3234(+)
MAPNGCGGCGGCGGLGVGGCNAPAAEFNSFGGCMGPCSGGCHGGCNPWMASLPMDVSAASQGMPHGQPDLTTPFGGFHGDAFAQGGFQPGAMDMPQPLPVGYAPPPLPFPSAMPSQPLDRPPYAADSWRPPYEEAMRPPVVPLPSAAKVFVHDDSGQLRAVAAGCPPSPDAETTSGGDDTHSADSCSTVSVEPPCRRPERSPPGSHAEDTPEASPRPATGASAQQPPMSGKIFVHDSNGNLRHIASAGRSGKRGDIQVNLLAKSKLQKVEEAAARVEQEKKQPQEREVAPAPPAPTQKRATIDLRAEKNQGNEWSCTACTLLNQPHLFNCVACETPRPKVLGGSAFWSCPMCTMLNLHGATRCEACDERRPPASYACVASEPPGPGAVVRPPASGQARGGRLNGQQAAKLTKPGPTAASATSAAQKRLLVEAMPALASAPPAKEAQQAMAASAAAAAAAAEREKREKAAPERLGLTVVPKRGARPTAAKGSSAVEVLPRTASSSSSAKVTSTAQSASQAGQQTAASAAALLRAARRDVIEVELPRRASEPSSTASRSSSARIPMPPPTSALTAAVLRQVYAVAAGAAGDVLLTSAEVGFQAAPAKPDSASAKKAAQKGQGKKQDKKKHHNGGVSTKVVEASARAGATSAEPATKVRGNAKQAPASTPLMFSVRTLLAVAVGAAAVAASAVIMVLGVGQRDRTKATIVSPPASTAALEAAASTEGLYVIRMPYGSGGKSFAWPGRSALKAMPDDRSVGKLLQRIDVETARALAAARPQSEKSKERANARKRSASTERSKRATYAYADPRDFHSGYKYPSGSSARQGYAKSREEQLQAVEAMFERLYGSPGRSSSSSSRRSSSIKKGASDDRTARLEELASVLAESYDPSTSPYAAYHDGGSGARSKSKSGKKAVSTHKERKEEWLKLLKKYESMHSRYGSGHDEEMMSAEEDMMNWLSYMEWARHHGHSSR